MDREAYLNSEGSALRHCYYRILGFRESAKTSTGNLKQKYEQHYHHLEERYKTIRQKLQDLDGKKTVDEKTWREAKKEFRQNLTELEHEVVEVTAELG